jgi:CRISPR/Cas system-associated endonuclease Cas1
MEEFRALIVDSAVLATLNTRMVKAGEFTVGKSGCLMKPAARKSLILETAVGSPRRSRRTRR